jgi:hypothetical protein
VSQIIERFLEIVLVLALVIEDPSIEDEEENEVDACYRTSSRHASKCETVCSVSSPMFERRKVCPRILP